MSLIPMLTRVPIIALIIGMLAGCALLPRQLPTTEPDYWSRAVTRTEGGLRVSTAVLSAAESAAVFGVPLAERGIQPVWIKVENHETQAYYLLSPGLDPNFFPASEAAEAMSLDSSSQQRVLLDRRFRRLAFQNPIPPGVTASGFVLTNRDRGVKLVQIDLVASGKARSFSILAVVPDFPGDYKASAVFQHAIYPPTKIINYTDDAAFRAALERLPCCATNKGGTKNGDPLNLVIVGGLDDAFPGLVRRGWHPTEEKWLGSVWQILTSALSGNPYPNAPVSDLYLFGRPQDLALQKARDNIHERNHMRLWLSPLRYNGKKVWVGQVSRDIGSRLTFHTSTFTTHKIDPDVDAARAALTEDMAYSQNLTKFGLVKGVGRAIRTAPRENLTTDPYYTDGYRAVLVFDRKPTSMANIDIFEWGTLETRTEVALRPVR